jgi:hypothetical protein
MTDLGGARIAEGVPVAPTRRRRLLEWFWRGAALRTARAYLSDLPVTERHALERALVTAELADRAYDPVEPLRTGSALAQSVSLYREAAYWALRAQSEAYVGDGLAALFESVPSEPLIFAAGGVEELALVRRALVERSFVETATLPPELLPRDAERAQRFVHALLRRKLAPQQKVGRLLLQRAVRTLGLLVVVATLLAGAWSMSAAARRGPDLAAGKPWRASSSSATCQPAEHRCAGVHTDMFFQTQEEKEPWLEIDLGREMTFNEVEVVNRADCCPDRAVPLVVEVSRDRTHFQEVSRRTDTFSVWHSRFAQQTARYVRLRVLRRSIFHLDKVAVRNGS